MSHAKPFEWPMDGLVGKCIGCSETHTVGIDAIWLCDDMVQCAWCHLGEFGVWPSGMTMASEDDDEGTEP